jgi:tetratricopeptide (TPR) repeat protein
MVQAEEKLREALSNEPSHLEATFNLAVLEWQEGRIDDQAVVNRLTEASGRSALGASAMALACQVHLARGGLDAMGDVLDLPLQGSEEPETLGALGTALAARGAHAAAEKVLAQALRGEAKNLWLFASYIRALQALGKEDTARRALSQGRNRFGDFPESVEEVCQTYRPWYCTKQSEFLFKGEERIVDFDLSRDGELAVLARNANTILLLDARSGEALNQFRLPRQSARANLSQLPLSGGVETRTLRYVRFAGEPPEGGVPEIVVFWEQTRLHFRKKQAAESSGDTMFGRVRILSPRGKVEWLSQMPLTKGHIYDLREIGRGRFLFRQCMFGKSRRVRMNKHGA